MAYNEFAYFYDEFNGEADYDALYSQIHAKLEAQDRKSTRLNSSHPSSSRMPSSA